MKKKTIAISGGLGKIGFALALKCSANFNVLIGDNDLKKYKSLSKKIQKNNIKFYKGDLTKEREINNFINFGKKNFQQIDFTIHCCYPKNKNWDIDFIQLDQQNLNKTICDHLGGAIIYSQKFIKYFLKIGGGKLIHFSSIHGVKTPKFDHYKNLKITSPIGYATSKSGIISMTKYLAKFYGTKNIQINCISPGGIKSDQHKIFKKRYNNSCLSKGLLDVKDLFSTVFFLLNDQSKFINGQNIIIDDGWSL
jgi:NAD(P)-dependent dehydrogenase (short-subunit alcohol dehydrogenase family)